EPVSNPELLQQIARIAPEAVRRAIRYSGLVLQQHSPRRTEIDRLTAVMPEEFGEFVRILDTFDIAYRERVACVEMFKQPLSELSPLELLVYATLYAFEYLVPRDYLSTGPPADPDTETHIAWKAINDLMIWKLGAVEDSAFRLTERDIGNSLAKHLSPFLFPSLGGPKPRKDLYDAFNRLLAAQIELNSFNSRSADAFSYDDSISFVPKGDRLEIVEHDPTARAAWKRNGEKLTRLHYYWLYRATDAFVASGMGTAIIGSPENHEENQFAYIKSLAAKLQLTEVYGLDESLLAESGLRVDLFQAILSLNLMTAFFNKDYILPYLKYLGEMGNSRMALSRLAFGGLLQTEMQNRFSITWSERAEKIARITGWTVTKEFPHGNARAAEAILDFWTSDWAALSARIRKGERGLNPELFERPILKMGRYLFQLPWVVAMQNNVAAAINNLRRIGARRMEAGEETRRIEKRLGGCFEQRGFRVQLNYRPERTGDDDPGEVDLICARDEQVLVLEIKSGYLRVSMKDAWLHGTKTLRKAGLQLQRKVQAVKRALHIDDDFAASLGLAPGGSLPIVLGWIVDTSIEHDHQQFNGFLKVSLEEVLIALRDDRHLLHDPGGLRDGTWMASDYDNEALLEKFPTLYPDKFSLSRFIEVVESEAVWEESEQSN
ncbi:MAG: hypothetical protein KDI49_03935, partial [Gammaproteobacteria bacterium]|nr:hypothetical protein [Gammaproteobacteria bacterium]